MIPTRFVHEIIFTSVHQFFYRFLLLSWHTTICAHIFSRQDSIHSLVCKERLNPMARSCITAAMHKLLAGGYATWLRKVQTNRCENTCPTWADYENKLKCLQILVLIQLGKILLKIMTLSFLKPVWSLHGFIFDPQLAAGCGFMISRRAWGQHFGTPVTYRHGYSPFCSVPVSFTERSHHLVTSYETT
jgi:hypothetical protein